MADKGVSATERHRLAEKRHRERISASIAELYSLLPGVRPGEHRTETLERAVNFVRGALDKYPALKDIAGYNYLDAADQHAGEDGLGQPVQPLKRGRMSRSPPDTTASSALSSSVAAGAAVERDGGSGRYSSGASCFYQQPGGSSEDFVGNAASSAFVVGAAPATAVKGPRGSAESNSLSEQMMSPGAHMGLSVLLSLQGGSGQNSDAPDAGEGSNADGRGRRRDSSANMSSSAGSSLASSRYDETSSSSSTAQYGTYKGMKR